MADEDRPPKMPEFAPPPTVRDDNLSRHKEPHLPIKHAGITIMTELSNSLMDNFWHVPERIDDLIQSITTSSSAIAEQLADLENDDEDPEFLMQADEALKLNDRRVRELVDAKAYLEAMRGEYEKAKKEAIEMEEEEEEEEEEGRKGPYTLYTEGTQKWWEAYKKKSNFEKYGTVKEYVDYRRQIWEMQNVDTGKVLPPPREWFPEDGNMDDGSDDEIEIGAVKVSAKCGLTLQYFKEPVKNHCGHTFEKDAILSLLGNKKEITCPTPGCSKLVVKDKLVVDRVAKKMAERLRERETAKAAERELMEESEEEEVDEDEIPSSSAGVKKEAAKRKSPVRRTNVVLDDSD